MGLLLLQFVVLQGSATLVKTDDAAGEPWLQQADAFQAAPLTRGAVARAAASPPMPVTVQEAEELYARYCTRAGTPLMGAAKDGPFTPVVQLGKAVLGDQELKKIRGKLISYHSQAIKEFCEEYGVPKGMQQNLIKKAKTVGSDLGFLS